MHKKDADHSASFLCIKKLFNELHCFGIIGNPVGALVAFEPCHLSLGIADALDDKFFDHHIFCNESAQVSADPAIFKTKVVETVPAHARGMQCFYFVEHAGLDAFAQSRRNELVQCFARACDADRERIVWR